MKRESRQRFTIGINEPAAFEVGQRELGGAAKVHAHSLDIWSSLRDPTAKGHRTFQDPIQASHRMQADAINQSSQMTVSSATRNHASLSPTRISRLTTRPCAIGHIDTMYL